MKVGYRRKMRLVRYGVIGVLAAYAVYVASQLPARGAAGDGPGARDSSGCGQCHGNAGGQAYVVKDGVLFTTKDIFPNGPAATNSGHALSNGAVGGGFAAGGSAPGPSTGYGGI